MVLRDVEARSRRSSHPSQQSHHRGIAGGGNLRSDPRQGPRRPPADARRHDARLLRGPQRAPPHTKVKAAVQGLRQSSSFTRPESLAVVGGDFNFPQHDDAPIFITATEHLNMHPREGERRRWADLLSAFTPVAAPAPTRQEARETAEGRVEATASAIDHLYISTPPLLQTQFLYTTSVLSATKARAELNDHAPLMLTITPKPAHPREARPVPKWVAAHPIFARLAYQRLRDATSDDIHPNDGLRRAKQALHNMARETIGRCTNRRPEDPQQALGLLMQLPRALARNDTKLGKRVLQALPNFKDAVSFDHAAEPRTLDAAALHTQAMTIVARAAKPDDDATAQHKRPARTNVRHEHRRRWESLWLPSAHRVTLAGVAEDTDTDADDEDRQVFDDATTDDDDERRDADRRDNRGGLTIPGQAKRSDQSSPTPPTTKASNAGEPPPRRPATNRTTPTNISTTPRDPHPGIRPTPQPQAQPCTTSTVATHNDDIARTTPTPYTPPPTAPLHNTTTGARRQQGALA